jgi:Fe-S cluster biogenesis protein NfuA/nitrite reductase/ring-hydroxylating ferredoxin subunit
VDAIQALLALHGDGLARVVEILRERGDDAALQQVAGDDVVGGLLLLHGVHPVPLEGRVRRALDRVRPYLESHGGNVQLLEVREGAVSLRLEGSCDGCPSSTMTLKYAIEQAIAEAAPDVTDVNVAGVAPPPVPAGFIPLTQIRPAERPAPEPGWQEVDGLGGMEPSVLRVLEVGGTRLACCRLGETWYAYRDGCAACSASLDGAHVQAVLISCPACGRRFDVRHAGRCADDTSLHLEPVPLLIEGGKVRMAVPTAAAP